MPKMNLTNYMTKDYVNNLRLLKMEKQTQSNPILSASGGFIQTPWYLVCVFDAFRDYGRAFALTS